MASEHGPPSPLGINALVLVAILALAGSQAAIWISVNRAASAADRGEAEILLAAFETRLGQRGQLDQRDLKAFLDAHRELGLRYASIDDRGQRIEAGEAILTAPPGSAQMVRRGGRVRAVRTVGPLPPPRGAPAGTGPPHDRPIDRFALPDVGPGRGPPGGGPPPPIVMSVELEPRLGADLRRNALGTSVMVVLVLLLLVGLGFALRVAARERWRLTERAERDRHLARLGEMSAVLGHELRNPLTSLKGHAQLLEEALPPDDPSRAKVNRIVGDAARLEELTTNLLEFVRSGELQREPTEVAGLVRDAIESVGRDRFALTVRGGSTSLPVDPARLRQAITNVLDNAAQASESPSEVVVEVNGESLSVSVSDHGSGLPAGEEAAIFEPFHTRRVRGTGLGLPIAKRIVEAHHGAIYAENRASGGARFTIVLPRVKLTE